MAVFVEISPTKYGDQMHDVPRAFSIPGSVNQGSLRMTLFARNCMVLRGAA